MRIEAASTAKSPLAGRKHAQACRFRDCLSPSVDAQLLVDVRGVPFHGNRRNVQLVGNFLIAEPLRKQLEDLLLTPLIVALRPFSLLPSS